MLSAEQMRSLPHCFTAIADPRRAQGQRHRLPVVLGIAAGATLCGMRGYKAIFDWADALGQQARERFGCRREDGRYLVPSEFVIRDCLVRIEPDALDRALNAWNQAWGKDADALAIDGKTNPRWKAISRCCSRSAASLISSMSRPPTTAVSKRVALSSVTTWRPS